MSRVQKSFDLFDTAAFTTAEKFVYRLINYDRNRLDRFIIASQIFLIQSDLIIAENLKLIANKSTKWGWKGSIRVVVVMDWKQEPSSLEHSEFCLV